MEAAADLGTAEHLPRLRPVPAEDLFERQRKYTSGQLWPVRQQLPGAPTAP